MDLIDDRFELEKCIAAGGMGTVYRALDHQTGAHVALKVLHADGADAHHRFLREAKILAQLKHPAIVRHVAHGTTTDGTGYLAMEWLEGETLEKRLESGAIPPKDALDFAARLTDALAAAHARGIVHRDIKPANILLQDGRTDRPRLLDFGVARILLDAAEMTQAGVVVGTPAYMAPEQIRAWSVDQRVDMFALGCVLFECLTGHPPWVGTGPVAIMAKILFEEPPRPSALVPELPDAVSTLVLRLLEKDREQRPKDAFAIAAELRRIPTDRGSRSGAPSRRDNLPISLGNLEYKLVCVVLAEGDSSLDFEDTLNATQPALPADIAKLVKIGETYNARIEVLLDGSIAAVIMGAGEATDLVARAARTALALRAEMPEVTMTLATGRAIVTGQLPTGEAIESAALLLGQDKPALGAIRIDDATKELLSLRFTTERDESSAILVGERNTLDETRPLLGRPTPCVGREAEISAIWDDFSQCVLGSSPRTALVLGPAGSGKSRLRHELMARIASHAEVWVARGDPIRQGSSLGMLGQAIRHATLVREGDAPDEAAAKILEVAGKYIEGAEATRVAEFLGEICGVHFPDEHSLQLKAARQNPLLMADQTRRAFEDFLLSVTLTTPVVLVLEDLQWGDLPTAQFVDAALRNAHDRRLFVFALGRPDVDRVFPDLWAERKTKRILLGPLAKDASEELIRAVLGDVPADKMSRMIELASGNAFALEELIRALAEGKSESLPRGVLAMALSRLEALPQELRLILRAASIFGETFWPGGISILLGLEPAKIATSLSELVEREVIVRHHDSRFSRQGEEELMFRHSVLREAAYAMLIDEDRGLGHRLAAKWLQEAGERDAVALAQHYDRGGDAAGAAKEYARAAEQALEVNDLNAVLTRSERAAQCGARGEPLAYLRLLEATAYHWRAEYAKCERSALDALQGLRPLSAAWYRAAEELAEATLPLGQIDPLVALSEALYAPPGQGNAVRAFIVAAATVSMQLLLAGKREAAHPLIRRMEDAEKQLVDPGPLVHARSHFAHATQAMIDGDIGAMLEEARDAVKNFDEAGDHRNAALMRTNLAYTYMELGAYHEAETTLRAATTDAERIGLPSVVAAAKQNLGWALARQGVLDAAREVEAECIALYEKTHDERMEGKSRTYLALILAHEDLASAEQQARRALAVLRAIPTTRTHALAALSTILAEQGRPAEALLASAEAIELITSLGGVDEGEALIRLAHVKALLLNERNDEAKENLRRSREELLERASRITNATWQNSVLSCIPENAEILRLGRVLLDAPDA